MRTRKHSKKVGVYSKWGYICIFPFLAGYAAFSLIIAGGVGNLIDRLAFGFVTDMFNPLFVRFAVFNVADICITVGGALTVIYVIFLYDRLEKKEGPHDAADLSSDR